MTKAYEPTPEEIRQACEEIRATWTDWQTRTRAAGLAPIAWELPEVDDGADNGP